MENAKRNRYGRRGSSDQQRSTDGQPPPLCQSPSEQQSDTDPEHASRAGDERKFRNSYSPSPHYPPLSVRAKPPNPKPKQVARHEKARILQLVEADGEIFTLPGRSAE